MGEKGKKILKGFEQKFASLRLQTPLKIKGNLKGSRANSPQAPVHWLREVTKAKLSQAEQSLGKLGQAGPS